MYMNKKVVLVVDDEPDIHYLLKIALSKSGGGIELYKAMDGREGFQKYEELVQANKEPNLVLMDLKMPGMDGVESTKKILEKYPDATIYAFTAYGNTEIADDVLAVGAKGIIPKSDDFEEILLEIDKILKRMDSSKK
jgi:CheY-like chemotaxis protein